MNKKNNNKGFTLAELLIVVAIIAVLVAIAIPVFTTQLERSKEATDAANIRAAYAEVMAKALTDPNSNWSVGVPLKQQKSGWQNSFEVAGLNLTSINASTIPTQSITISFGHATSTSDATITIANVPIPEGFTATSS